MHSEVRSRCKKLNIELRLKTCLDNTCSIGSSVTGSILRPGPAGSQLLKVFYSCNCFDSVRRSSFTILPPFIDLFQDHPVPITTLWVVLPDSSCGMQILKPFRCHKQIFTLVKDFWWQTPVSCSISLCVKIIPSRSGKGFKHMIEIDREFSFLVITEYENGWYSVITLVILPRTLIGVMLSLKYGNSM